MKKILFVNDYIIGGGVEKVMYDLISNLPKNKYDITVGAMIENKSEEYIDDIHRSKDKTLFVTVGRLTHQKGYERLIDICFKLNKSFDNYELWIIGDGEDSEKLNQLIQKYKLSNVKLLGAKQNPYKYMKVADWMLCSSYFEGFSTVLQEATVIGTPILTTDCAGAKELLANNEYGIIVENTDEGLEDGMSRVLLNRDLLIYYRGKALQRKQFVNLDERMKKIIEFL